MKSTEPQLFKYKVVYTPKYVRKNGIRPDGCFDDITEFFEEIIRHMQGQHSKYHKKSPMLVVIKFNKHEYNALMIRFRGVRVEDVNQGIPRDVELISCYYDDQALNANPYKIITNEVVSMRQNLSYAMDIIKHLVGHYYYSGSTLERNHYFIEEKKKMNPDKIMMHTLVGMMKNRRNTAITKHDLLNEYIKTLEPGVAYTRIDQEKLCHLIYRRFGIGIDDREKIMARPFHYLNHALKYTDFKVVPLSEENQYRTVSAYYGIRTIVPKEQSEKVDFFAETQQRIKKAIRKKE